MANWLKIFIKELVALWCDMSEGYLRVKDPHDKRKGT